MADRDPDVYFSGEEDVTTSNTSCYSLKEAHTAILVVHAVVLAVIVLFSLAGNGLVLVLVARFKRLRTHSTVVSLCLVIADLLFTLCYTSPAIITTGKRGWVFGSNGCKVFGFLASDLLITRWLILSLLCLDRFCTVRFPFSYRRRKKWVMITLALLAWIIPLVVSAIPIQVFTTFELRDNHPICLPTCHRDTLGGLCRIYYAAVFTVTFVIGTIIPLVLYSWLYHKARKLSNSSKHKLGHHIVQIANGILVPQPAKEIYQTIKREKQATITFVLIFVTVVVTGMPGYLLQITRSINIAFHCKIPLYIHFIIIEFFLCAPMLTPLVIMRDRDFRASIAKLLFCCGKKTGDLDSQCLEATKPPKSFDTNSRRNSSVHENNSRRSSVEMNKHLKKNVTDTKPTVYVISESSESISQC